jgi:hypothetical protein
MMPTLVAGFDPGNAETTMSMNADYGNGLAMTFPSYLGSGRLSELLRIRGGAGNDQLEPDEYALTYRGRSQFVGRMAVEQSRDADSARGDTARYWSGHTLRLLLTAVGALLPEHPQATLRLVTGLPVEVWSKDTVRNVQESLVGTHTFTLNQREYTITVEAVVVMMEGAGALVAHGLPNGAAQAVIDVGGRTTDLFYTEGKKPLHNRCGGLPVGVETISDLIQQQVLDQYGRTLRPDELRDVLRSFLTTTPHHDIYVRGERVPDLSPLLKIIQQSVVDDIARFVGKKWRSEERGPVAADAAQVLLIGGGAYFFAEPLRAMIPHLRVPLTPELANVRGYRALGERMTDADWARVRR